MTLQINTTTGQRALTPDEQTEVREGIGAQSAAQVTAAASSAAATAASAAVAAHASAADPHPGQYAAAAHTHALLMTQPERDKLAGIAPAATANATDAALRDRATHTGTQPIASVDGLQATLDGKAPATHTHTAAQISDATAAGRGLLTAADAAAQRAALVLGNVNNTADADKPVSTAQAAAIAAATTADAIADTLETAPPADLARIQAAVSGGWDDGAAAGNGVTVDTVALNAAAARGLVRLGPGKTYLINGQVAYPAGCVFAGDGATIKRAPQVITTTTTPITANATNVITVASTVGLYVGQRLSAVNGGVYNTNSPQIQSIVGNVVSLTASFNTSFVGTTTIFDQYVSALLGDDVTLHGVTFDGNRATWPHARWETCAEIQVSGTRPDICNVRIVEAPGEGIVENSLSTIEAPRYTKLRMRNIGGNGIHLSNSDAPIVSKVDIRGANLFPAAGHADGCIAFSDNIVNAKISDFHLSGGLSGIGGISSTDNSQIKIMRGTIENCSVSAIAGTFPTGTAANDIMISHVTARNCVKFELNQVSSGSSVRPSRWKLNHVVLVNTKLNVVNADKVTLTEVDVTLSDTVNACVTISGCTDVTYNSGTLTGGANGIYHDGASSKRLRIAAGVTCIDQTERAVNLQASGDIDTALLGANFIAGAASTAGWYGVIVPPYTSVDACTVRCNAVGQTGILALNDKAIIRFNKVRGVMTHAIRTYGGTTGNVIQNNIVAVAVSNGGGAGNPDVTGNVVMA